MIPRAGALLLGLLLAALAPLGADQPQGGGPAAPVPLPGPSALDVSAARLKARLSWDPLTGSGWFERAGDRLSFALGLPLAVWDFSEAFAIESPLDSPKGPLLTEASLAAFESRFRAAEAARGPGFTVAAILIDPGHGGKDPGAIGEHKSGGKTLRVLEKDLALSVSRQVFGALRERYPDKRILLSREGDSYPSLDERVEMANAVELSESEAIIYVSLHANSSFNKNARGFEVWYLNPEFRRQVLDKGKTSGPDPSIAPILNAMLEEEFTTESVILARDIESRLKTGIGATSPDRGIRPEEWFVVRNAKMPSVLVEMGFVTNAEEAKLLSEADYLKKVADAVYSGIVDFVSDFEKQKAPSTP